MLGELSKAPAASWQNPLLVSHPQVRAQGWAEPLGGQRPLAWWQLLGPVLGGPSEIGEREGKLTVYQRHLESQGHPQPCEPGESGCPGTAVPTSAPCTSCQRHTGHVTALLIPFIFFFNFICRESLRPTRGSNSPPGIKSFVLFLEPARSPLVFSCF